MTEVHWIHRKIVTCVSIFYTSCSCRQTYTCVAQLSRYNFDLFNRNICHIPLGVSCLAEKSSPSFHMYFDIDFSLTLHCTLQREKKYHFSLLHELLNQLIVPQETAERNISEQISLLFKFTLNKLDHHHHPRQFSLFSVWLCYANSLWLFLLFFLSFIHSFHSQEKNPERQSFHFSQQCTFKCLLFSKSLSIEISKRREQIRTFVGESE